MRFIRLVVCGLLVSAFGILMAVLPSVFGYPVWFTHVDRLNWMFVAGAISPTGIILPIWVKLVCPDLITKE